MPDVYSVILELIQEDIWLVVFVFLLFLNSCPRKRFFAAKIVGGCLGVVLLFCLQKAVEQSFPTTGLLRFLSNWELILSLLMIALYMRFMFQCNWNMMLFGSLAGFCAQEIMFGVWAFLIAMVPAVDTVFIEFVVCCIIGICIAVAQHYFLAIKITPRSMQILQKRSLTPMLLLYLFSMLLVYFSTSVVIFLNVFFDPIRETLAAIGEPDGRLGVESVRMASIFANLAGNILVLFALRHMLRYSESDLERELLEQIREQDRKQYTHFRDNVDYINTKCHDLKHYLDLIQKDGRVSQEELREVSDSITRLDTETHSGNETIDLILTDRRRVCANQGIELLFQTDGTSLDQLDVIDTYTIFCNILDNAIEYVRELPPQERTIRLGIRTIRNMVFIHQENMLVEELTIENGLPVTTKYDSTLHGFGLKSVQNTVRKRAGDLVIRTEGNRFEIDIYFPINK